MCRNGTSAYIRRIVLGGDVMPLGGFRDLLDISYSICGISFELFRSVIDPSEDIFAV